ncbi:Trm112 family protein [Sphingomonas prati]|uniref:Trm112 family protein n=1 Tax=Sphingomonas prati TaxID=1843237 RepID=A0A7W9BRU1_9SPHN|nr:Trm112 family protein [Sphingomonas prati]MBB5728925.1 hypothetical protein [Sphingomonas prati]GGE86490.1 hypothetical protein GCM10011404_19060 [Sphingomonas prati]
MSVGPGPVLVAKLVCPRTRTALRWDAARGLLVSDSAGVGYPVTNGVPVLLVEAAVAI